MNNQLEERIEKALDGVAALQELGVGLLREIEGIRRDVSRVARAEAARPPRFSDMPLLAHVPPPTKPVKDENGDTLINSDRVAQILNRPRGTLHSWHGSGVLKYAEKRGRRCFWRLSDVTRFAAMRNETFKRVPGRQCKPRGPKKGGDKP